MFVTGMLLWRDITSVLFLVTCTVGVTVIYREMNHDGHHEEVAQYSYMRKRAKQFAWRNGNW